MKTRTSLLVVPWFVILVWALIAQPARTTDFLLFIAMFAGMAAIAILVMRRTGRGGAASHDPFGHQAQGTDVITSATSASPASAAWASWRSRSVWRSRCRASGRR